MGEMGETGKCDTNEIDDSYVKNDDYEQMRSSHCTLIHPAHPLVKIVRGGEASGSVVPKSTVNVMMHHVGKDCRVDILSTRRAKD